MNLRLAESVHACVIRLSMDFDLYTGTALMNMYFKFESLCESVAWQVFDEMPEKREIGKFESGEISCKELSCRIGSEELESEGGMLCCALIGMQIEKRLCVSL